MWLPSDRSSILLNALLSSGGEESSTETKEIALASFITTSIPLGVPSDRSCSIFYDVVISSIQTVLPSFTEVLLAAGRLFTIGRRSAWSYVPTS